MDKTFTFTIEQIKDIYCAGIRRGTDEASAFEWGSTTSGNKYDEAVDWLHDFVNTGIDWQDEENYVNYDTVMSWFK
jgi:hypothetical protein